MKLFRLALLVLIMGSCNGQKQPALQTNKDDNTLLWEVSGNGLDSASYLFGTFHMLCKDDIHFSEQLQKAVTLSDKVYMELDLDDPNELFGAMMYMNMNDGRSLKDLYSAADYQKVMSFFRDSADIPPVLMKQMETMKPFFLESMLYPKLMPCKAVSGVDEEIAALAHKNKKEIKGLETMAFQASVFDSIPYKEQAKELLKTIDSLQQNKLDFDTMIMVYKSQEIDRIEKLFNKEDVMNDKENMDLLLYNRNANWVKQLKSIMKKQPVFVAVGAGHLVGEKGLIESLRKEGFTLRPLVNK